MRSACVPGGERIGQGPFESTKRMIRVRRLHECDERTHRQSGQARIAEVPDVPKECEEIFTLAHEGIYSSELIPDEFSPVQVKRRSHGVANDVFPFDTQRVRRRDGGAAATPSSSPSGIVVVSFV